MAVRPSPSRVRLGSRRAHPDWLLEPRWPWAGSAGVSWVAFARFLSIDHPNRSEAISALLIAAVASSVGFGLILVRRRAQEQWLAVGLRAAGAGDDVVFSRVNVEPQPCPCGCARMVHDPTGWLPSMTRWVLATGRLCEQVTAAMTTRGSVQLDRWELVDDTAAVTELLVEACHNGLDSQSRFEVFGIVSLWENRWDEAEAGLASELSDTQYRLWKAATIGARNGRHGALVQTPDPARYADYLEPAPEGGR